MPGRLLMFRWRVAILVCVAIAISYLDRQSLPVAVAAIQKDIPLTNTQFGALTSMFLLAYALMYAGGGALDRSAGHAARVSRHHDLLVARVREPQPRRPEFWMLAASRFLLGAGEGGGFPAATKVIAERFPVARTLDGDGHRQRRHGGRRRRRAAGDRRDPHVTAAGAGCSSSSARSDCLWSVWWASTKVRTPRTCRTRPHLPDRACTHPHPRMRGVLVFALRFRQVWGLVFAKFLTDAAWFFYISWLPKYLYDARGFDVKQVGYYAWVPFAASGVGSLAGGWFSSWLLAQRPVGQISRASSRSGSAPR